MNLALPQSISEFMQHESCGSGDFVQSLNFVDILTGWDESTACINNAQVHVFKAIKANTARFPFAISGIDSDNGLGIY
jgi:hypothetical protein